MKNTGIVASTSSFAARLRMMREETGLSLRRVAKATGVSPTFLSDIERGRRMPSRGTIEKLAESMARPVGDLLKFDPRESLDNIVADVTADPQMGPAIAKICRRFRIGKINRRDLEKLAE